MENLYVIKMHKVNIVPLRLGSSITTLSRGMMMLSCGGGVTSVLSEGGLQRK